MNGLKMLLALSCVAGSSVSISALAKSSKKFVCYGSLLVDGTKDQIELLEEEDIPRQRGAYAYLREVGGYTFTMEMSGTNDLNLQIIPDDPKAQRGALKAKTKINGPTDSIDIQTKVSDDVTARFNCFFTPVD
jgi:hypothetical protein